MKAALLLDAMVVAEARVVDAAIRWATSRMSESQWPDVHAEDADALEEAVRDLARARIDAAVLDGES